MAAIGIDPLQVIENTFLAKPRRRQETQTIQG
jgi:hypothetical protein